MPVTPMKRRQRGNSQKLRWHIISYHIISYCLVYCCHHVCFSLGNDSMRVIYSDIYLQKSQHKMRSVHVLYSKVTLPTDQPSFHHLRAISPSVLPLLSRPPANNPTIPARLDGNVNPARRNARRRLKSATTITASDAPETKRDGLLLLLLPPTEAGVGSGCCCGCAVATAAAAAAAAEAASVSASAPVACNRTAVNVSMIVPNTFHSSGQE